MELLNWQQEFLPVFKKNNGNMLLWCKTGLGKGVLTSYIASKLPMAFIVVPPHLIMDWVDKLSDWGYPLDKINVMKLGKKRSDKVRKGRKNSSLTTDDKILQPGVNIISISRFQLTTTELKIPKIKNSILIVDECHRIRNYKANGFKRLNDIRDLFEYTLMLSATPIGHNNVDLFAPAMLCNNEMRTKFKKSFYEFERENVHQKKVYLADGKSITQPDYIFEEALNKYIYPFIYRQSYESAGVQQPEYIYRNVSFDIEEKHITTFNALNSIDADVLDLETMPLDILENLVISIINKQPKFHQLCNCLLYTEDDDGVKTEYFSMKEKIAMLNSIVDSEGDRKGFLTYLFKGEREVLSKLPYVYEYKEISDLEKFEKSDKKILICQQQQLGEGVRLKKSDYIIEFSLSYNFILIIQSRGRLGYANRSTPVIVYSFIPEIEEVKRITKSFNKKLNEHMKEFSIKNNE